MNVNNINNNNKIKQQQQQYLSCNQGGIEYFASWEPHLFGQHFARDSVIQGLAGGL